MIANVEREEFLQLKLFEDMETAGNPAARSIACQAYYHFVMANTYLAKNIEAYGEREELVEV